MPYLGEIAALLTAFSWSACALFFTAASRKIGSFSMSHYRMLFGFIMISTAQLISKGTLIPIEISNSDFLLLAASGIVGYFICDTCLFQSYVDIGPKLGILLFNLYPFGSALMARIFLDEVLSFSAWIGMTVTLFGVCFVLIDGGGEHLKIKRAHLVRGISLALAAALIQGVSFTLAKPAMATGGADPLTATFIRALFGGSSFWLVSMFRGRLGSVLSKFKQRRPILLILAGAVIGPFIGVWLSITALKLAPVGIASTLMSLMPILILPMSALVHKERISWRALVGAAISCAGVAILLNGA